MLWPGPGGQRIGDRGFSLFEMLMVLLLLGILMAVAVPATGTFLRSLDFRRQADKVAAILRYARLTAISSGKSVILKLAEDPPGAFELSGGVSTSRQVDLQEEDTLSMEPEKVTFFPEGYVTPATVIFKRASRTQTIELDPLTALPIRKRGL